LPLKSQLVSLVVLAKSSNESKSPVLDTQRDQAPEHLQVGTPAGHVEAVVREAAKEPTGSCLGQAASCVRAFVSSMLLPLRPLLPPLLQGMAPSTGLIGTPARKWAAQPKH
jgi:hypothetical protein